MGEGRGAQCSPSSGSRNGKEEGLRAKDSPARKEAAGADHPAQVYADPSGAHTSPQVQVGRQMTGHSSRQSPAGQRTWADKGTWTSRGPGKQGTWAGRGSGQMQTGLIPQPAPLARNRNAGPQRDTYTAQRPPNRSRGLERSGTEQPGTYEPPAQPAPLLRVRKSCSGLRSAPGFPRDLEPKREARRREEGQEGGGGEGGTGLRTGRKGREDREGSGGSERE